jgi:hypothetical protein
VLEAPWPAGHRWAHWRRVRFDDGATLDVDTDAGPLHFRSLRMRGEAAKRLRAQPADEPVAKGGSLTGPTGPETLRYRTMRTQQRCVALIGAKYRSLMMLSRSQIIDLRVKCCRSAVFASKETERAMRRVHRRNFRAQIMCIPHNNHE